MEAIGEIADLLAEKLAESGRSRGGEKSHRGEQGREFSVVKLNQSKKEARNENMEAKHEHMEKTDRRGLVRLRGVDPVGGRFYGCPGPGAGGGSGRCRDNETDDEFSRRIAAVQREYA
jgi:hypothetical protein